MNGQNLFRMIYSPFRLLNRLSIANSVLGLAPAPEMIHAPIRMPSSTRDESRPMRKYRLRRKARNKTASQSRRRNWGILVALIVLLTSSVGWAGDFYEPNFYGRNKAEDVIPIGDHLVMRTWDGYFLYDYSSALGDPQCWLQVEGYTTRTEDDGGYVACYVQESTPLTVLKELRRKAKEIHHALTGKNLRLPKCHIWAKPY